MAFVFFAHDGWVVFAPVIMWHLRQIAMTSTIVRGAVDGFLLCAFHAHVENFTHGVFGFRSSDDGTLPIVRQAVYRLFST